MNFKQTLTNTLLNLPGWHTRRKIVVIESDDFRKELLLNSKKYK